MVDQNVSRVPFPSLWRRRACRRPEEPMNIDLDLAAIQNFAIAILIGALVGIERKKRRDTEITIGGIRTFVLMAMLGAAGGFLSRQFGTICGTLDPHQGGSDMAWVKSVIRRHRAHEAALCRDHYRKASAPSA